LKNFQSLNYYRILLSQVKEGKVNFDLNLIDSSLGSLLHYAVIMCNVNNIENGRSLQTTKDLNLDSLLNSSFSKLKIIECLLAQGVEINLTNKLGETPLHMCRNRHVCKLLLDNGAITGIKEITGKQPLYSFLLRANYDMCVELIKSGCELDTTDRLGNSLLCTLMNSNAPIKLILLLLEAGIGLKELSLNGKFQDKIQKDPKLFKAIEYRLKNPPSLKEIARKSLRLHLNKINRSKSIVNSVSKLEKILPSSLQDYILLNLNNFNGPLLIK
jgi:ankyrin repeat protein